MARSFGKDRGDGKKIDIQLLSLYLGLVFMGGLSVYSVSIGDQPFPSLKELWSTLAGQQFIWMGISFLAVAIIQAFNGRFWQRFAYPIYGLSILLLILVLFLGTEIKGATSWFRFGSFGFQPSEVAKFGCCLVVATFLDSYRTDLSQTRSLLLTSGFILLPMALILLQPDAGSALIFLSFGILFYRAGLPSRYVVFVISAGVLFLSSVYFDTISYLLVALLSIGNLILLYQVKKKAATNYLFPLMALLVILSFYSIVEVELISTTGERPPMPYINKMIVGIHGIGFLMLVIYHYFTKKRDLAFLLFFSIAVSAGIAYATNYVFLNILEPHQQERLNMWIRPDRCEPDGPLYNLNQSKLAIGSGGLDGKGIFKGTLTKLDYVPEQSTDFIFCVIGEEQGFIGSAILIILFILFLNRIIVIGERQRSDFSKYYAYGIAGIFFVHFFVNIGMTMGLMPIIGIPLPFISKGGSSLLGFSIMVAVLINLDSRRYHLS